MSDSIYSGKLHLILGPMFSGKTTELIRRYNRYHIGNKKCVMIKFKGDTRYDTDRVATHDNIKINAICVSRLADAEKTVYESECDAVCIDEIQFYEDAPIYCDKWANEGFIVEACGLSGTFKRTPFPIISELIPLAENVHYFTAICKESGGIASFSKKITPSSTNSNLTTNSDPDSDSNSQDILIGGHETYVAVDRKTYFSKKIK